MQSEKQIAAAQGVLGRGGVYVGAELVKAALETALSAAEPIATVAEMGAGGMRVLMPHPPGSTDHLPIGAKLYAAPPAPSVAVKLDSIAHRVHALARMVGTSFFDDIEKDLRSLSAALSAQVQDVAGSVIKLGTYGRAYDLPEERRAYTYEHQPGNIEAHKLGRACSDIHSGGDWIDRGLNLLNSLQREGFGVFELPAAPAKQEGCE